MAGVFYGIGSPLSSAGADLKSMTPITKLIVINNKALASRSRMTYHYYIERGNTSITNAAQRQELKNENKK
ncbi:hypothetical protein K3R59_001830 [Salmonella enterica]|nr:hypothetical protein [Salmonella enterica]